VAAAYRRNIRGTGSVAQILYSHRLGATVPARVNGLRWEAAPLDWMDQQVLKHGTWESATTEAIIDAVAPGQAFWDIGANAGVHALTVKHRRPTTRVLAFEPSPATFTRLRINAAANGLEVELYCVALSSKRGYRMLSVSDRGNSGQDSLRPWEGVGYSGAFRCWCDTVDELVADGASTPGVVKIDVEGAEMDVIAGMRATLNDQQLHTVIFESSSEEACEALRSVGFSVDQLGVDWIARR
jgi:FkbM family methyltransferase